MRKYLRSSLLLALFCLIFSSQSLATNYYTYVNGGSSGVWAVANTWTTDPSGVSLTASAVPGNNDIVTILNGFTVSLNANVTTTGLAITINNGGTLDLSTFTMATISSLSGSGILKIKAGYFPTITTNNFLASYASGATVEYYDFTASLVPSLNYPNLTFTNTTSTNQVMTIPNASAYSFTVFGNLVTRTTGTGTLAVTLGSQVTNLLSLTINGNITIGSGTTLGVGAFNAIHSITLLGSMTNNGTVQFSNAAQFSASTTGAANFTFTGSTDNSLACNGVTNFYTLTVNKGLSSTNILSVTSTSTANFNLYSNAQLIFITNGTLKLGANISITRLNGGGNYDIGTSTTSPMFWIDGASVNTNSSALVAYGKFRISAGTFTSLGGEGTVIREEGQYIIEGGTFTTEKFRPSNTATTHRGSFIMSGGIVNASGTGSDNNYARFSIPFPDQVFIMSGGIINVSNPQSGGGAANGGIHIGCNAANSSVTGGTINAILSGTASLFYISSVAPFWNLNITRTGGTPTTVRLNGIGSVTNSVTTAQSLVVANDFTIDGTNTPVFDANGLSVSLAGNFTINSGGTYTPNSNTTTFNGTANQSFSNSGTITTGLYNLTMNKTAGTLILSGSTATYSVTQTLTLTNGVLNDGGKTILALGNIYNAASHTGTGNITLNGSATQTISGNGSGVFGNLILSNTNSPGATVTADLSVSGALTLAGTTNSLFDINQYKLSLTSTSVTALATTGNGFSSSKMVRTLGFQSDGGIQKTFGNLSAFTYAIGVGNNYTPATSQLTSAPTTYGTITVKPDKSRQQFVVAGNTNNLVWYWKVVSSGFTGLGANAVTQTFQYVESSVSPSGDDVNYIPARYNPSTWSVISDLTQVDDTNNIIYFTGVGYIDGEFTAGVPAAFGVVKVFYSKRSGVWTDVGAGTTPWSNVSHSGADATTFPVVGDQVFIGDGSTFNHVITITSNAQACGGLEINSGSTLDLGIYTGHNFGTLQNLPVTGSGLMRISSAAATAEFPAGDFGNFIRTTGGTVEYYSTGTQDFTIPVSSASPSILPLITYKNILLTPGTGRFIRMPDQDERIFSNMTVQGASSTGVVRLNSSAARTLTVNGNLLVNSGDLQFQNGTIQTLQMDGNVTIGTGAIFDIAGSGTVVTNLLSINGNLINNGTFDMANGSFICNTIFTSSSNTSITGTGTATDFNLLTVSKGTSQTPVLDVNASAFSLSGATQPLVLNYGTFRLSSAQTVTFANGTDFTIPSTAKLSANGGTLQLTGGDGFDVLLAGNLEVLSGAINVGTTANDNSIEYSATGQPTITASGGTLQVKSQIRRSSATSQGTLQYNQSGVSIVSIGLNSATTTTRGVFEILNSGSSFTMSGGTLRVNRSSGSSAIADLYLQPSTYSVSGGTIEIGTGASSQTVDINSIITVYNVNVAGTTNTARLEYNGLTMLGSLSIQAGDIFNANSLDVKVAGDFTNLNTTSTTGVTAGGYQAGSTSQTTTINGTANNQIFTGASGNLTNFGNLLIYNTFSGGTITLQSNTNLRVNGTFNLFSGVLAGGANTITTIGTVSNSSTHTSTTGGSVTLAGASNQAISGSGSGKFGNLILNNASGATFYANQEVTGTLTFTSGAIYIGSYGLTLSNTSLSAISGATSSRYIITAGKLSDPGITKAFAGSVTTGNFVFPIGVSGKYTPANYTITTGSVGGNITITPVNSKHPNATGSGTAYINYYWNVTSTIINLNALTHTYTYVAADQSGTVANYRDARFKSGAWTIGVTAGNPNTTTRVITFTNTGVTGDYTAGEATAFVNPLTYTSIASGNWESDLSVWDIDPPGTNLGPPAGSFVIISIGHTVTMTGNAKTTATISVRGRLNLGSTIGHDFGTVSTIGGGERTIQIQSSIFPAGDFTAFTAVGGGTVEYDGTVILPTQNTYNNLSFTSAGTKTLPNADLTVNGNFSVFSGTVSNAVNNRNIVLTSAAGDFTNNAVFNAGSGGITVGRDLINTGAAAVFTAGSGTSGLRITRNLTNSVSATFNAGSDSLGVRGSINNSGTFIANSGAIRVSGNLNNTNGSFTGSTGILSITGNLTNNRTYAAGAGTTTVSGSFSNSGALAVYNANANALTVAGDFLNSGSATFNANTGSVSINGNWTNSATFNSGTGTVTFSNASARTLTGATAFYNLTRSNGGSLTLSNAVSVGATLTLNGGNIITGSNTISLTSTASQPVTTYGSSSFIDGKLSISYPGMSGINRIFPIGKGSIYRPVTIQQNAASTSPVVQVEMINTPPTGSYPVTVGSLSEARYYAIDLLSGTMNSPTVQLSFNTNGTADESISTPGNVHIVRATSSSGPWTDEGGSGVFSPAAPAGYAISGTTTVGSSTFFALAHQNTALPISLLSFEGKLNNGIVILKWVTASEKNNDFFTIERSTDGHRFDSIGYVQGAGNSYATLHYTSFDSHPLTGMSYYRLRQTDFDSKFSYSKIIVIENYNSHAIVTASLFPNPSNVSESLFLSIENAADQQVHLQVTAVTGVVVFQGYLNNTSESGLHDIRTLFPWERGVYIVRISTQGLYHNVRVVIN